MKSIGWVLIFLSAVAPWRAPAVAGNRAMIERRVQELHELHMQVVDRLPEEKKKEGAFHIRATVYPREGTITADGVGGGARGVSAVPIGEAVGPEEVVTFKAAIIMYHRRPVEIVPLPGTQNRGEYAPFYLDILRMAKARGVPEQP